MMLRWLEYRLFRRDVWRVTVCGVWLHEVGVGAWNGVVGLLLMIVSTANQGEIVRGLSSAGSLTALSLSNK